MVGGAWSVVGGRCHCGRWSVVGGWSVGGGFVLRPQKVAKNDQILSMFVPKKWLCSLLLQPIKVGFKIAQ